MNPNKIDSVYGYLTPKRILTSLMNPSQKNKGNRSLTNSLHDADNIDESQFIQDSTPRRQRQSYKKKNGPAEPLISSETDNFIINDHKSNKSYQKPKQIPINPSAPNINNQNQQNISQKSRNSRESSRIKSNKAPPTERQPKKQQSIQNQYEPRQIDKKMQKQYLHSNIGSVPNKRFVNLNKNPDMAKLLLQQTIKKLIEVKGSLQQQIAELKGLLDNISDTIVNMDYQFQRIKQAILLHTSRALDSAFRQYKKNLVNLNLYESIQGQGINKVSQINQTIDLCGDQQKLRIFGGRQMIQKKIHQYKIFTQSIKKAKKQCYSQKPIITEQKIKKFETILKQIAQF